MPEPVLRGEEGGEAMQNVTLGEVYRGGLRIERSLTDMDRRLTASHRETAARLDQVEKEVERLKEEHLSARAAASTLERSKDRRIQVLSWAIGAMAAASGWVTLIVSSSPHH